jgi:hypothetical protein
VGGHTPAAHAALRQNSQDKDHRFGATPAAYGRRGTSLLISPIASRSHTAQVKDHQVGAFPAGCGRPNTKPLIMPGRRRAKTDKIIALVHHRPHTAAHAPIC